MELESVHYDARQRKKQSWRGELLSHLLGCKILELDIFVIGTTERYLHKEKRGADVTISAFVVYDMEIGIFELKMQNAIHN